MFLPEAGAALTSRGGGCHGSPVRPLLLLLEHCRRGLRSDSAPPPGLNTELAMWCASVELLKNVSRGCHAPALQDSSVAPFRLRPPCPPTCSFPRVPPCLYPAAARLCCLSALELFPCLLSPTPVLSSSSEGSQYVAACCCLLISLLYSIQFNGLSCVAVGSENRPKLVINSPAAWGREGGFGKHLHFPSWRWDTCRQGNGGGVAPLHPCLVARAAAAGRPGE